MGSVCELAGLVVPWTSRRAEIIVPTRRPTVAARTIDGEALFYDEDDGRTFYLNRTARAIWDGCDGRTTTREIAERLTRNFEVTTDAALDAVEEVVAYFATSGLLMTGGGA